MLMVNESENFLVYCQGMAGHFMMLHLHNKNLNNIFNYFFDVLQIYEYNSRMRIKFKDSTNLSN